MPKVFGQRTSDSFPLLIPLLHLPRSIETLLLALAKMSSALGSYEKNNERGNPSSPTCIKPVLSLYSLYRGRTEDRKDRESIDCILSQQRALIFRTVPFEE